MADDDAQSGVTKVAAGDKPKTAVDGNAPGGPAFRDPNNPVASGSGAVLGAQVRPETQTREDDGHRTLAKPVTDPGPYLSEESGHKGFKMPAAGETLNAANPDGYKVTQRHSTAPDWAMRGIEGGSNTSETTLGAHVVGVEGKASDVYRKERGEGLTSRAQEISGEERELAPGALATDEAPKEPAFS